MINLASLTDLTLIGVKHANKHLNLRRWIFNRHRPLRHPSSSNSQHTHRSKVLNFLILQCGTVVAEPVRSFYGHCFESSSFGPWRNLRPVLIWGKKYQQTIHMTTYFISMRPTVRLSLSLSTDHSGPYGVDVFLTEAQLGLTDSEFSQFILPAVLELKHRTEGPTGEDIDRLDTIEQYRAVEQRRASEQWQALEQWQACMSQNGR